jgi:hypothetical protein
MQDFFFPVEYGSSNNIMIYAFNKLLISSHFSFLQTRFFEFGALNFGFLDRHAIGIPFGRMQ